MLPFKSHIKHAPQVNPVHSSVAAGERVAMAHVYLESAIPSELTDMLQITVGKLRRDGGRRITALISRELLEHEDVFESYE